MNKPKTNIYDIDGKLIRGIDDTHQFTIEEAQERIKYYLELLKALSTEDLDYALKASTYNQYVDNLVAYCIRMKMVSQDIQPVEPQPLPDTVNIPTVQVEEPMKDIEQIDIVDLEQQEDYIDSHESCKEQPVGAA